MMADVHEVQPLVRDVAPRGQRGSYEGELGSTRDEDSRTALHWAVIRGHQQTLFELMPVCDAIVNAKDRFNRTALFYAVGGQEFSNLMVEMLLLGGAQVNYIDVDRKTPLLMALERKDRLLTGRLAEFDSITMHMIIAECHPSNDKSEGMINILDFLLTHGGKDLKSTKNRKGQSILHASATTGNMAVVDVFMEHGRINPLEVVLEMDKEGDTPLISAARGGWFEMAKFLVQDCDFNKDIVDANGMTALHWAAHQGHTAIVSLLVDAGADIMRQTETGFTSLFLACNNRRDETGVLLLEKTGIPKALTLKDAFGRGLTRVAALNNCSNILTKLIEYAKEEGNDARVLWEHSEGCSHAFAAIGSDCRESAMTLLKAGAAVTGSNGNRDTALHCAVSHGDADLVKWLLENRSESRLWMVAKNKENQTPAGVAATRLEGGVLADILADLLHYEEPARVRDLDTTGWIGIHWATFYARLDLIKLLVRKTADGTNNSVLAADTSGRTAADLARRLHPKQMKLLQWLKPVDTLGDPSDVPLLREPKVSDETKDICGRVPAFLMDVYGRRGTLVILLYVSDILCYGPDPIMSVEAEKRGMDRRLRSRWIHLPLNNLTVIENMAQGTLTHGIKIIPCSPSQDLIHRIYFDIADENMDNLETAGNEFEPTSPRGLAHNTETSCRDLDNLTNFSAISPDNIPSSLEDDAMIVSGTQTSTKLFFPDAQNNQVESEEYPTTLPSNNLHAKGKPANTPRRIPPEWRSLKKVIDHATIQHSKLSRFIDEKMSSEPRVGYLRPIAPFIDVRYR
ncbi:hypothetical protein PFICI_06092 [Pestalotiopsis fici W106-1]|uniref:Uncharacterized protein n=1 Tax=Pestalotiopsis fici (strain W106-1 / CGMCC3.15140) TaxID=1229662 RepID=W3X4V6_PESFW|nr:uncharacterized protein PFICI_06092 [Pestalotiopsis fici W106-1]ETS81090.1 hypothetical protein PFICI_06092 [Pestalotiopsis fici W106-1]